MHSTPQAGSRSTPVSGEAEVDAFIQKWSDKDGGERANYQLFIGELCELLDVPSPNPATSDPSENAYVFERRVEIATSGLECTPPKTQAEGPHPNPKSPIQNPKSQGFIDCYKRGGFVFETKQHRRDGVRLSIAIWVIKTSKYSA